jgi:hypothetical protein
MLQRRQTTSREWHSQEGFLVTGMEGATPPKRPCAAAASTAGPDVPGDAQGAVPGHKHPFG